MNPTYGGLNDTLAATLTHINAAGAAVDGTLQPVFNTVGVLMLVFACIKLMWQKDLAPLAQFVVNFILLMTIINLSARWMPLTEGYMAGMGSYGARIGGFVTDQLSPASVILRGLSLADKMYTQNVSWMRTIFGTSEDNVANVVMMLVCLLTIFMAVAMAVFVMAFFVVMKFASVVCLIFLPFIIFDWSRFMAAPGIARLMAYGVQMLVMSLVAGLMFSTLDTLHLSDRLQANEAITTLVVVAFFAFLFFNTTNIAREQISGMPVLSLNEVGNALGKGAMMAAGAVGGLSLGAISMSRNMSVSKNASAPYGMKFDSAGGGDTKMIGMQAPAAAVRMLERPPIDAEWTEAKDLAPKAAQRMLSQAQRALPDNSTKTPPPRRQLPPPSRFS